MILTYAATLKLKSKGKLVADIVDHVPKEISRAAWLFLERLAKVNGKLFQEKCRPSPIPKGELEVILSDKLRIADERKNILERFKEIIQSNYLENADTDSYEINDVVVIKIQNKGFRESQEDEEEEEQLIVE